MSKLKDLWITYEELGLQIKQLLSSPPVEDCLACRLNQFLRTEGLPIASADEVISLPYLTRRQVVWLENWLREWEDTQ